MKTFRRILLAAIILLILIALGTLALNALVIGQTRASIVSPGDADAADCILVLGCGLFPDGTPGYMLTRRLNTAIELYQRGAAPRLLVSGDHGRADYDEVNAMKRYAVEHGVPPEDIFMDHAGFSTYDSMVRAHDLFGCERVIIVTQEYHLYRAVYDAAHRGMSAQGVAAPIYPYGWRYTSWLYIREVMARVKDVGFCLLGLPASVMGEPIPMQGSGQITDDAATRVWLQELTDGGLLPAT